MMLLFLISVTISVFLIAAAAIVMLSGEDTIDTRLEEISAPPAPVSPNIIETPNSGLARAAVGITSVFKPIRGVISGSDEDTAYRLALAGFRKTEHIEIFTATKMLLPVIAIVAGSFFGDNMIAAILVGVVLGYMGPDLALTRLISGRQESIRRALPDALDLLVICMEAGLGIDQAMVRVGEEMRLTSPALADELQIINREQRAGKPRLDAWRSMAERVDIDFVRQFVTMLVQTERFGTPIANALGQFADTLRTRRTQAAEEAAAKAGVKLLFPLVFFIFPSVFVVALGPAIISIGKILADFSK
ncbi:MAG TPA: type II secretion system F family protein [Candidatus Acidoferrum sp.]|nr:type II secretion system F family protein [Candidatus Acidoferrum sp.]